MAAINQCISWILISVITLYRWVVSGLLGRCCRFEPSCSAYAIQAIKTHGCWKGGWLSFKRLLRCHPWHAGGIDPIP